MKKYIIMILMLAGSSLNAQDREAANILIYTRNGEGYIHGNIEASVEAIEELCGEMNIGTVVSNDPGIFLTPEFQYFDAVIFSNTNNEAFLNEEQRKAFQDFIRSGKGFVGIHSACGSEREWPWFWSMLGGKFVYHPKLQEFEINITDPDHLSTRHLPRPWTWEDECYIMDHLNPNIHVLISVDLRTVEDKKKDEYPGTVFGNYFPLAWCHEFEGGRCWYTALGHKVEYYRDEHFRKHLSGGIQWVLEL